MEETAMTVAPETAPQEPGAPADAAPAAEEQQAAPDEKEDLIAYRFNHETKTVSRQEAPGMIQRLLKVQREAEKAEPLLDRLRYLAGAGGSTPEEYLASLEEGYDRAEYERFLRSAGGNGEIAAKLAEMSKRERQQQFRSTAALREEQEGREREEITRRMGRQLAELQQEFPEIREFKDLPEQVVKEALEEEISLLDSLLRYRHRNARRAESERERHRQAAAASAGSLRGEPEHREKVDENVSAFLAAFRR